MYVIPLLLKDTIFFALRGKYDHLSFLHIYHHCSMFLLWWIGCAYMAGGAAVPCTVINSSIHVVMYRQVTSHTRYTTTWHGHW